MAKMLLCSENAQLIYVFGFAYAKGRFSHKSEFNSIPFRKLYLAMKSECIFSSNESSKVDQNITLTILDVVVIIIGNLYPQYSS